MLTLGNRFNYPESSKNTVVDSTHPRRLKLLGLLQDSWNPFSKAQRTHTKSMQSVSPIGASLQLVHNCLYVKSTSFRIDFTIRVTTTLHLPKGMKTIFLTKTNLTPIAPDHSWAHQPYRMTHCAHVRIKYSFPLLNIFFKMSPLPRAHCVRHDLAINQWCDTVITSIHWLLPLLYIRAFCKAWLLKLKHQNYFHCDMKTSPWLP